MPICQGSSAWESTRLKTELSRVQVPPLALIFAHIIKNDNILIQDIILFSEFLMKSKKAKTAKSKKTRKKPTKKKAQKSVESPDDTGIVLIDDDLEIDTEKELEERRAYLEEARSQETSD